MSAQIREYRTIDKSGWPAGPWHEEPDKKQFVDAVTGLPCLIVRARSTGALCGYVGVAPGHPWYGQDYDDVECRSVVHGGLTYSEPCAHSTDESRGICHIPAPGEPDSVWWLGFDCAHSGDLCPAHGARFSVSHEYETYRDLRYVEDECARLALHVAGART